MPASKFTEIMDPEDYCTSPHSDVRLEDILAATALHQQNRGRTPSETSNSSRESRQNSQNSAERNEKKTKQRLSRLLSINKK